MEITFRFSLCVFIKKRLYSRIKIFIYFFQNRKYLLLTVLNVLITLYSYLKVPIKMFKYIHLEALILSIDSKTQSNYHKLLELSLTVSKLKN